MNWDVPKGWWHNVLQRRLFFQISLQKTLIFAATDVSAQSLKSVDTFNGIRNAVPHLSVSIPQSSISLHSVQWTRSVKCLTIFFADNIILAVWFGLLLLLLCFGEVSKMIHKHSNFIPKMRLESEWEKWGANQRNKYTYSEDSSTMTPKKVPVPV